MQKWLVAVIVLAVVAGAVAVLQLRDGRECNILLVSIDTLRPDRLGCYGYAEIETPNIDRLAARGVLFADAIATAPLTLPSHASLLTGLSPVKHGIRDNGAFVLTDRFTTLAELLRQNGYTTGAFVSSYVLDSSFGLNQGFETYDDEMAPASQASTFLWPERRAEAVNQVAIPWLRAVEEPFFAFVHYYDPHLPYDPPPPFDQRYAGRPYDGEIAYTDQSLGAILETLRELDRLENTLIIVLSDHGEGLGDHQERGHGMLIYESTMKVALIFTFPDAGPMAGRFETRGAIDHAVQLTDVFPTVLDLLDIDHSGETDGQSLVPLLKGDRVSPRFLYFESLYAHFNFKWSPLRGLRHNEWKYILAPEEELYNLARDPREEHNLYGPEKTRAEDLNANLVSIAGQEDAALAAAQRALTQEDVKKLLALGYLAGGHPSLPKDIEPRGLDPKRVVGTLGGLMWDGRTLFDRGELDQAADKFRRLAELDPMNPQAHVHLAKALMEMGRTDEAQDEFVKAIEIDSTHSGAFFPLANAARKRGDIDRALFYFQLGAKVAPQTSEAVSNIGALLVEKGMADSAIVVLRSALLKDPNDHLAQLNLGLAYVAKSRLDEALTWFRRVLKRDPANVKALANIASIYISKRNIDSTIVYLEKARQADPSDATMLANLGNAYRQQGMTEKAADAFQAAVALEPDNVMALFGLAAVRAQEGKKEESIALLNRILRIDPDFRPAQHALQSLSP